MIDFEKNDFYSHLNTEDITDADYTHTKRVCKDFEIENLEEYHDLYVQGDTFLLADLFENFRIMCLKIYEFGPAKFPSAPGLAWQAALEKTGVKLDILTDIDMLLEKKILEEKYVILFIDLPQLITNT